MYNKRKGEEVEGGREGTQGREKEGQRERGALTERKQASCLWPPSVT